MLALTRREGERVIVDTGHGYITVTVVKIERGQVRLAFQAPRSMRIDREEVAQKRREEKQP